MFAFLSEVNYICNATRDFLLFAFAIHFVLVWAAMLDFSGFFESGLGSRKDLEYRYRYSSMILVYTIDYRGVGSVYCHISYARLIQTRTLVPAKASVADGRIIYPFPIPYSSALQNHSAHKCSCHWIETPSFFFFGSNSLKKVQPQPGDMRKTFASQTKECCNDVENQEGNENKKQRQIVPRVALIFPILA